MLSKKNFNVLCILADEQKELAQIDLEEKTGYSLGSINKIIKELKDYGFVDDKKITELGLTALKPYEVKKAIFIAAGFGSRLVPITLNAPKPLVRVKGKELLMDLLMLA